MTETTRSTRMEPNRIAARTGVAVGLVVAAVIAGGVLTVPAVVLAVFGGSTSEAVTVVAGMLASELGYLLAGLAFVVAVIDEPRRSYLPVASPTAEDLKTGALALGGVVAVDLGRRLAIRVTGLEPAGTVPVSDGLGTPFLVAVVAIVVLVAPPAEELFFRGVVQRYVGDVSSAAVGIGVATLLFVPIHAAGVAMSGAGLASAALTFMAIAGLSVIAGLAYARTDNLLVPIAVHLGYNATTVGFSLVVHVP